MMDRGTVRKNVDFYSKNKFEKLVHLVGFIIRNNLAHRLPIPDTDLVCGNIQHDDTPPYFAL